MYLIPFDMVLPEIAKKETRSLTLRGMDGIPPGDYALLEAYCPDPLCECLRVMLNIISRDEQKQVAAIGYGFDRSAEDAGPYLDPLNAQSRYASALLGVIAKHLELDPDYVERLKRHYALVKVAAADPSHPIQKTLQSWQAQEQDPPKTETISAELREAIRVITEHEPRVTALERATKKSGAKHRRKSGGSAKKL